MSFLATLLLAYAAWALLLFLAQRRIIFPGGGPAPAGAETGVPGLRRFWIDIGGGRVEAWFVPPEGGGPAPALLFAHGNAELIDHSVRDMASFARSGIGVMLVEYPGYGRSGGSPSAASIERGVLAAYDLLAAQPEVDRTRIVGYGRSLGAAPIAALSRERALAAMVLQSAFTSLRPFAHSYLLPGFLVRDPMDVEGPLRAFSGPLLLIHGERDEVVPVAHGRMLAAAGQDVTFLTHGCGHNDCPPDWAAHVESVAAFLFEILR